MARETVVFKCMNEDVNKYIDVYEVFGWELQSNQIAATYKNLAVGNDIGADMAAANELTFTREKDTPYYAAICGYQNEFFTCKNEFEAINESEPKSGHKFHWLLFILLLCAYGAGFIYLGLYVLRNVLGKAKLKKWHSENDPKTEALLNRMNELLALSRNTIGS